MLNPKAQPAPSAPTPAPMLHYEIAGVPLTVFIDGSMQIGNHQLHQQTVFALAVGLSLPGMRAAINRIERTRQAAEALDDGSDQVHDRR